MRGKVGKKETEGEADGCYNEDAIMRKEKGVCRII